MSRSPFYRTGVSKSSPLHQKMSAEDVASGGTREERAKEMKKMQDKLNTLENGSPEYDKLATKIDAHDLKSTNKVRGTNYIQ